MSKTKMKKLMASSALLACLSAPTWAENLHYNIIEFSESVSVRIPNDTMSVILRITENGQSRQEVSNAVTRRLNAVLARAKSNKTFEVESGNRRTYPEYGNNRKIVSWSDTAEIRVQSQSFDALNKFIAESQNEAMIDHISFSVSPEKREKAVEEASKQALKSFQHRAKTISKTMGFSNYKIVKIELNQSFSNQQESPVMLARSRAVSYANDEAVVMQTSAGMAEIHQSIQGSIQMQ